VSNFLSEWNDWIAAHQALLVSVGLPLFGVFITAWTSYLAHKVKVAELKLNGRIKLSDQRQQTFYNLRSKIDNLTDLLADLIAEGSSQETNRTINPKTFLATLKVANSIMMHVNLSDALVAEFKIKFGAALSAIQRDAKTKSEIQTSSGGKPGGEFDDLRRVCAELIKGEWRIIENDLKDLG
jgi:hypothetical protein